MTLFDEIRKDGPLAYWRMSDTPSSQTFTAVNYCSNPSLEVTDAGFSTGRVGSTDASSALEWPGSRQTDGGRFGVAYYRATASAAYPGRSFISCPDMPAGIDRAYTLSFYLRTNRARPVNVTVDVLRDNGTVLTTFVSPNFNLPANTWFRVAQIVTIPDGGARLRPTVGVPNVQVGDTLDVDGLLYEEAVDVSDYFDGDSEDGSWDGTPGASPSRVETIVTYRYLEDENNVFRGDYSATGVTYNVPARPSGGDGASRFAADGSALVVGGNGAWDLGTVAGEWSVEFLARFDDDAGGAVLETDIWRIGTLGSSQIGYSTVSGSGQWGAPAPWQDNQWHHYVLTQRNGLLTIYVDGEDVLSYSSTNVDAFGSGTLEFAPGSTAVTLDEVAIYTRALDDGRVRAHYVAIDGVVDVPVAAFINPLQPVLTLVRNGVVTQQLTVTVQYSGGGVATPLNPVWSTSDPAIVSVSATGLVRALRAGSAAITVTLPDLDLSTFTGVSVLPYDPLPFEGREIYSGDPSAFVYDDEQRLIATTQEYWEVDPGRLVRGQWVYDTPVSLATLAFNITTLAGREGIPVADGENIRISTRVGRRWVPKTPDQKQISLAMWAIGTNEDGTIPEDVNMRTKFRENYNRLKQLFAVWDRQILLRRRVATRYGIVTMKTWVEPASSMDLEPTGPLRAAFTVDLLMTDPFWHGDEQKSDKVYVQGPGGLRRYPRTYRLEYGSFGNTGIFTLLNEGTHEARLVAEIHGPVENPRFLNMDTNERFRLLNDVSIDAGDVVEVDFYDRTIELRGSGSRYWWLDRTTDWLHARPGEQRFQFSHDGYDQSGYVIWRWEPTYL